jgi:hypothetical protein
MDVSGGLPARRVLRAARGRDWASGCEPASDIAAPGFISHCFPAGPAKHLLPHGNFAPELSVFLLRGTIRGSEIEHCCSSTSDRFHRLSSVNTGVDEFSRCAFRPQRLTLVEHSGCMRNSRDDFPVTHSESDERADYVASEAERCGSGPVAAEELW